LTTTAAGNDNSSLNMTQITYRGAQASVQRRKPCGIYGKFEPEYLKVASVHSCFTAGY
jgi:hypothetical protein